MQSATVLIVDDEPQLLRLMARVLGRDGHVVHTAADAATALQMVDDGHKPDLAVIDLNVPPMRGDRLMRALHERDAAMAVVLTSGADPDPALRSSLETARATFLRKPFAPRALSELVQRMLAGSAARC